MYFTDFDDLRLSLLEYDVHSKDGIANDYLLDVIIRSVDQESLKRINRIIKEDTNKLRRPINIHTKASPKQIMALHLKLADMSKTWTEVMLAAGYPKSCAHQPKQTLRNTYSAQGYLNSLREKLEAGK